jgi:purine-binding chemotaxis protein CheW
VQEVLDIDSKDIEPPPQYGKNIDQEFLTGLGKVKDKVIMLLNVDKILSTGEMKQIETI